MAVLQTVLCVVLTLTLVTSKPVSSSDIVILLSNLCDAVQEDLWHSFLWKQICLNEAGDSAMSSESSESNSSEETAPNVEASQGSLQPALPETAMPNAVEEADPLGTTALLPHPHLEPSPSTHNASNTDDTQTSADDLQLAPDDPSKMPLGVDISQDMPNYYPTNNADTVPVQPDTEVPLHSGLAEPDKNVGTCGTNTPHIASTYQEFPKGVTPPFPPHIINPTEPFSTATPMPIPLSTALTGVPVCFTFQLSTPEPDPPRGDS